MLINPYHSRSRRYRTEEPDWNGLHAVWEFLLAARHTLAGSRTLVTNLFSSPVHRFFVPSGTRSPCARHRPFLRHTSPFGALRYCACIHLGRRDEPLRQHARTSAPRLSSGLLLRMQPVARARRMRQDVSNAEARHTLGRFNLREAAHQTAGGKSRCRTTVSSL